MLKKISLAALGALTLVAATSAQAEEFLETTGNRSAPAYSAPAQQPVAPFREFRLEHRGVVAPATTGRDSLSNSARDRVISVLGQG